MDTVAEQKAQASTAPNGHRRSSVSAGTISQCCPRRPQQSRLQQEQLRRHVRTSSRAWKESRDVAKAKRKVEDLQEEITELETELEEKIDELKDQFDPETTELEPFEIKPLKKNIKVKACGLAWLPHIRRGESELEQAW